MSHLCPKRTRKGNAKTQGRQDAKIRIKIFASSRLCVQKMVQQRSRDLKRSGAESAAVSYGMPSLRTRRPCVSTSSNQSLHSYGGILDSPREGKRQGARTQDQNQNLCVSASLRSKNGPTKEPRSEAQRRGERSSLLRHLFSASSAPRRFGVSTSLKKPTHFATSSQLIVQVC